MTITEGGTRWPSRTRRSRPSSPVSTRAGQAARAPHDPQLRRPAGDGNVAREAMTKVAAVAAASRSLPRDRVHVPQFDRRPRHAADNRRGSRLPARGVLARRRVARESRSRFASGCSTTIRGRTAGVRGRRCCSRTACTTGSCTSPDAQRDAVVHGVSHRDRQGRLRRRGSRHSRTVAVLRALLLIEAIDAHRDPGHPAADYARTVFDRFEDTGVRDQVARLCMERNGEVPELPHPDDRAGADSKDTVECAALALAGSARYLATVPATERAPDAHGSSQRRSRPSRSPIRRRFSG